VIGSPADISCWEAFGWDDGDSPRPCALHVDTGMNRLGLTHDEALAFAAENGLTGALTPRLLMSHLACGDETLHPLNRRQLESFQAVRAAFAGVESSLSNSGGVFLGPDFHFDLARPGIALYGGKPFNDGENPMRAVATLEARVVQVRRARSGETASYGAHGRLARDSTIAIVSVGYADGYHRSSSFAGVPLRRAVEAGGHGFIHGRRVPVLGRVTMDLTLFDVTDLGPEGVAVGDWIELFGQNIPVDEAATAAGTISYEMLTALGRRYQRRYVGGESDA
jgi:alanine racemase